MEFLNAHFKYLTEVPDHSLPIEVVAYDENELKVLKETYNKLKSANLQKQEKIAKMIRLIEDHKHQASGNSKIKEKLSEKASMQAKVFEKEALSKSEIFEQKILIHKKEKLIIRTQLMRGNLIELQKNFDRITTNYSAFHNSQFASKYSLLLSHNALEEFKYFIANSKGLFENNIKKLEKRLSSAADLNSKLIKRASSVDENRETMKFVKKEFYYKYKNSLQNFHKVQAKRKASTEQVELYKSKFRIIKSFVQSEEFPLSKNDIFGDFEVKRTIQKLKDLEYRSESLGFSYQKLSEQEAVLFHEHSMLKAELSQVFQSKNNSKRNSEVNFQGKASIATCNELEILCVKLFFLFANLLCEVLGMLAEKKEFFNGIIEERLVVALTQLREIKVGVKKRRPFRLERFITEKFIGKNIYNENRNDTMNSLALSLREIQEVFNSVRPNEPENVVVFGETLKSSQIVKAFLDKDTLKNCLISAPNKDLTETLIILLMKSHMVYQDRFKAFTQDSLYVLATVKKILIESDLDSNTKLTLKMPIEYQMRKSKSQGTSPYKIMEKPSKKQFEPVKPEKIPEILPTKDRKNVPRVYTLTDAALKRQTIMKEVLQNQKKETLLRTIEKKISKHSEKLITLPYHKKFLISSSNLVSKFINSSRGSRSELRNIKSENFFHLV